MLNMTITSTSVLLFCSLYGSLTQAAEPAKPVLFQQSQVVATWEKYKDILTFDKYQTLTLVDDGGPWNRGRLAKSAEGSTKPVLWMTVSVGD